MTFVVWLLLVPAAAFLLTAQMHRYAVAAQLFDIPNSRSSHDVPVPRGGGLAIVIVVLSSLAFLWTTTNMPNRALLALGVGGAAVASIGWWDDQASLPARWRLIVHLLSASLVVALAGDTPTLPLPGFDIALGPIGSVLTVLFIGWMLNLYNFMDGIDGIAGVEAVTVAGAAGALLWWLGERDWALLSMILSLASLGFLLWNWPPAKIFMGDAGSGFLGFTLAAMAVLTWTETALSIWPWLILLGVFIVDASVTLLTRVLRRQPVYEAHREHAYQHAARSAGSHRPITVAVLLINLLWLAPLAVAATLWPPWGVAITTVAWIPLLALCLHFRAGRPEQGVSGA